MIDTIFFDWGGVVASDPGDDFLMQLIRDCGATEQQAQEVYQGLLRNFMCGEISEAAFWDLLRKNYGLTIHENISEAFVNWRGLIVDNEVVQVIADAKAAGKKVAILSNVIEPTYNVLQQAGHYNQFDAVIASYQVGYAKPQPEIYQLALDTMHTTAEQSLFIDDKQKNIEPANELGFATILAENPVQIVADIRRYLD